MENEKIKLNESNFYKQILTLILTDLNTIKSKNEIARYCNCTTQHIYQIIKRGDNANISPKMLFRLCEYFGYELQIVLPKVKKGNFIVI